MKKIIDIPVIIEMSTFHEVTDHISYDTVMKRLIKAVEIELLAIENEAENLSMNVTNITDDESESEAV